MFRSNHGHHQVWSYLLSFHYLNELWCGALNINYCYAASIDYRWQEESKESKTIYVALVMPESPSGSVKYRCGVAVVWLFSYVWVPLWVTRVGSVLPVGQKYKVWEVYHGIQVAYVEVIGDMILVLTCIWSPCVLSHPQFRIWFVSHEVRWGSTSVCRSSMKFIMTMVYWLY